MLDAAATLVDRFWARVAAGCLALTLLVVVVAYASQPGQRDFDQVDNVLTDFVTAASARDGDGACRLLTEAGRKAAVAAVPSVTCAQYARSFGFDVAGLAGVRLSIPRDLPDRIVLDSSNMTGPDGKPVLRRVGMLRTPDGFRIDGLAR